MSSERVRQREVHKYYQSWLESSVGFQDAPTNDTTRYHADGTKLESSKDTALIAFAQLGCLKLNIKRGIITLISTTRQYILAEATTATSLLPNSRGPDTDDDIWFGNASIPRSQGISGSALTPPEYTAKSCDGASFTAPALVIDDLSKHPDFSARSYAGNGVSFYCGIPIVTKDGSAIGVYSLSDDKPRDGLQPKELRYISDLAVVIMRHLEIVKNEAARFRGELMVVGLGQFVQGASTITSQKSVRPRLPSPQARVELDSLTETRQFKGMTITAADPTMLRAIAVSEPVTHIETVAKQVHVPEGKDATEAAKTRDGVFSDPSRALHPGFDAAKPRSGRHPGQNTFSRAANILRECCGADGVLFFDAVSTNLAKRSSTTGFRSANEVPKSRPVVHGDVLRQRDGSTDSRASATAESEELDSNDDAAKACNLLGFAVDVTDQTPESIHALKKIAMTESILRRLTRKYPQGKVFYFTPDGSMSSSENDVTAGSATSEASMVTVKEDSSPGTAQHRMKNFKSKFADELKRLVPQAQSVIWLPMWDFSKQRWSAGAFLWTKMAEQLIVAQDDLVYLKTFANSIMIEVARQDAAFADDTKTTFIANISHELRSPLHGVIGSCELLKDTDLDEHQASLVKAIELCGKTLNDTVDHVLDYTKINQFMKRGGQLVRPGAMKSGRHDIPVVDKSMLDDDFDLAVLVQDAVETVCASQSSQHQRLRGQSSSNVKDVLESSAKTIDHTNVQVIFKLTHQDNWWVRSQPGAIKRILTNLVQNALKYTDSGTVTVALSQRTASLRRRRRASEETDPESQQNATITVTDTGRGMSAEFVRNHAFTPFSQESSFSDGTGLGLSIVQLIVDSLAGKIELKSNPEVGTEIKIHLTLPRCTPAESPSDDDLRTVVGKTAGSSMCLVRGMAESHMARRGALETALSSTASAWFGIDVVRSTSLADVRADFYLYMPTPKPDHIMHLVDRGSLPRNSIMILLVSSAAEKLELGKRLQKLEHRGIVLEIALHPVGPRKLGEVLKKCLVRKEKMVEMSLVLSRESHRSDAEGMEDPSYGDQGDFQNHIFEGEDSQEETPRGTQQGENLPNHHQWAPSSRPQTPNGAPDMVQSTVTPGPVSSISQTATPTRESAISGSSDSAHKRILLVDDNAINLNILKAAMKKGKLSFYTANDGLEALEAFKQAACADPQIEQPFTHVLMDINMPVMDGIESTRLIRSFERKQESRNRIERSRQRSAWSDGGTPHLKYSKPSSPVSGDDDDDFTSDFTGSLPVSPEERTEFDFTVPQSKRTRPLLSHLQVQGAGEPTRAMTHYLERGQPQSLLVRFVEPQRPQRATIIALSGVAFEQTQKDMFAAGADMFFAKPIKLKELLKLLHETPSHQE